MNVSVHTRLVQAMNIVRLVSPLPNPEEKDQCLLDACRKINNINDELSVLLGSSLEEEEETSGAALLQQAYRHFGSALIAAADIGSGEDVEDVVRRLVSVLLGFISATANQA